MNYHNGCIAWFTRIYEMAQMNGLANDFPPAYMKTVEKMCEVLLKLSFPGGMSAQFSDTSSPVDCVRALVKWAEMFDRDDFRFVATHGEKGRPPAGPPSLSKKAASIRCAADGTRTRPASCSSAGRTAVGTASPTTARSISSPSAGGSCPIPARTSTTATRPDGRGSARQASTKPSRSTVRTAPTPPNACSGSPAATVELVGTPNPGAKKMELTVSCGDVAATLGYDLTAGNARLR